MSHHHESRIDSNRFRDLGDHGVTMLPAYDDLHPHLTNTCHRHCNATPPPPYYAAVPPPRTLHLRDQPLCFHFQGTNARDDVRYVYYTPMQPSPPPYLNDFVISHIRVQNGHLNRDGGPVPEYCERIACVLRYLFNLAYVRCMCPSLVNTDKPFVDIRVVSSTPLGIVLGENVILPVMMDHHGFHTTANPATATSGADFTCVRYRNVPSPQHQTLFDYAYLVGTLKSREALMDHGLVSYRAVQQYSNHPMARYTRYNFCGGQPTGPIKIELRFSNPPELATQANKPSEDLFLAPIVK